MTMTISGTAGFTFPDNSTLDSSSQVVKAWVNFNGTGTPTIRAAYNVGSITDNGAGDYTVNFITAMQDANYCATCSEQQSGPGYGYYKSAVAASYLVGSFRFSTHSGDTAANTTPVDQAYVNVAIFR